MTGGHLAKVALKSKHNPAWFGLEQWFGHAVEDAPQVDSSAARAGVLAARDREPVLFSCMKMPKPIQSSNIPEAQKDKLRLIFVTKKCSGPLLLLPYPDTWEAARPRSALGCRNPRTLSGWLFLLLLVFARRKLVHWRAWAAGRAPRDSHPPHHPLW